MSQVWRLFEKSGYNEYGDPEFHHLGLFWDHAFARYWCWENLTNLSDPESIEIIQLRDVTPLEEEFADKKIIEVRNDRGFETVYETWYLKQESIKGKGES